MTVCKTSITDILAPIEKKQKEIAAQHHQPHTKADLLEKLRRRALTAFLGALATALAAMLASA